MSVRTSRTARSVSSLCEAVVKRVANAEEVGEAVAASGGLLTERLAGTIEGLRL